MADDPLEDILFLKNQLQQKNSKISSLEGKMKMTELKANREIKQAQSAEEYSKNMLKQEKNKAQNLNKQIHELKEEKKLMQKKIDKANEDKATMEKERDIIHAKYTNFKNQFRKLERLLPSEAFVKDSGLSIETICSYQELFYNFEDKDKLCAKLEADLQNLKTASQQLLSEKDNVINQIKEKKMEVEKVLKDNAFRIHEAESALDRTRKELATVAEALQMRENELDEVTRKFEDAVHELADMEHRIAQLEERLRMQVRTKQQELSEVMKQQYEKYYNQLKQMEGKYEENEKNTVNNLIQIEESLNFKIEQLAKEKQQMENTIADLNKELDQAHEKITSVESARTTTTQDLLRISKAYEEERVKYQNKVDSLEADKKQRIKEIETLKSSLIEANKKFEMGEIGTSIQLKQQNETIEELKEKIDKLHCDYAEIQQERDELGDQNTMLKNEINQLSRTLENKSGDTTLSMMVQDLSSKKKEEETSERSKSKSRYRISVDYTEYQEKIAAEKQKNVELNQKIMELIIQLRTQKERYTQAEQTYERNTEQLKESLSGFASRVDDLLKGEEIQKYIIKKLNDDLLQERNNNFKARASHEKSEKEAVAKKQEEDEKNMIIGRLTEKAEKLQADLTRSFAELKKQQEEKVGAQFKIKELEAKQQAHERQITQQNSSFKQRIDQQVKEIQRLQGLVGTERDKEKLAQQSIKRYKAEIQELQDKNNQLIRQETEYKDKIKNLQEKIQGLKSELSKVQKSNSEANKTIAELNKKVQDLKRQLDSERKNKTPFMRVPSLKTLSPQQMQSAEDEMDNAAYLELSEKESEIYFLKHKIQQLQEEIQRLVHTHQKFKKHSEEESNGYIQEIIKMKMKVAETEMAGEQKMYHYNIMRKKYEELVKKTGGK